MSQTTILKGSSPASADAYVTVDGKTIAGDGVRDPLRVINSGGSSYTAPGETSVIVAPGMAVVADLPNDTLQLTRSIADSTLALARVTGLISKIVGNGFAAPTVTEQGAGIVTLTTAEWDLVAGTTGGLTIAAVYYLSSAAAGHLVETPPSATGSYVTQVGYGMSATEMQLQIGVPVGPHA